MPPTDSSAAALAPHAEADTPTPEPQRGRSQVAVRELGYAKDAASFWGGLLDDAEATPELRWPLSLVVYDQMRRQDPQVSSTLRAVTHPVLGTRWALDPGLAREEVVTFVAENLGLPIRGVTDAARPLRTRDRFSWTRHLRTALLCLTYGHMVFEQVYRIGDDGRAYLRKLGERMPRSIEKWDIARDGGLISVQQYSEGGLSGGTKPMPVSRLVVYTHEREGANWHGTSLLRPAYKAWVLKDMLLRIGVQSVDRNGMGIPVYEGADGEISLDAGRQIAEGIRAGDNTGAATPHGAKLRLMGVEGDVIDGLPWVKYLDEQVAKTVLAHFLNLGGHGTGSWALGSTLADTFARSLQTVAQEVADTATAHIVEDLVDINFGTDEPAPTIVFDEIGSESALIAQALKVLVDAGVITTDDNLEKFMRTGLGLPAPAQENS